MTRASAHVPTVSPDPGAVLVPGTAPAPRGETQAESASTADRLAIHHLYTADTFHGQLSQRPATVLPMLGWSDREQAILRGSRERAAWLIGEYDSLHSVGRLFDA